MEQIEKVIALLKDAHEKLQNKTGEGSYQK